MATPATPLRHALCTALATLITGGAVIVLDAIAKLIDRALPCVPPPARSQDKPAGGLDLTRPPNKPGARQTLGRQMEQEASREFFPYPRHRPLGAIDSH